MTVPPNKHDPYCQGGFFTQNHPDETLSQQAQAERDRWRIEKRVSVGDVLKTLLVAAGVVLYVGEIEKATLMNSGQIENIATELRHERQQRQNQDDALRERMDRNDQRIRAILEHIRQALQRIEDKMATKQDKQ